MCNDCNHLMKMDWYMYHKYEFYKGGQYVLIKKKDRKHFCLEFLREDY